MCLQVCPQMFQVNSGETWPDGRRASIGLLDLALDVLKRVAGQRDSEDGASQERSQALVGRLDHCDYHERKTTA